MSHTERTHAPGFDSHGPSTRYRKELAQLSIKLDKRYKDKVSFETVLCVISAFSVLFLTNNADTASGCGVES